MAPHWLPGTKRQQLKNFAEFYDWKPDGQADETSLETTDFWEYLQGAFCCGIDNANDWDIYRPSNISSSYFPPSCCDKKHIDKDSGLCSLLRGGLYETGCLKRWEGTEYRRRLFSSIFCLGSVVLTLLAHLYSILSGM